jgi:hypothetical protein
MQLSFRLLILISGSQLVTPAPVAAPAATPSPQSAPVATPAPVIVVPVITNVPGTLPTYSPGVSLFTMVHCGPGTYQMLDSAGNVVACGTCAIYEYHTRGTCMPCPAGQSQKADDRRGCEPLVTPAPVVVPVATPVPVVVPVVTPVPVKMPVVTPAPVVVPVATPAPVKVPVATPAPVVVPVATPAPVVVPVATPAPAPLVVPVSTPAPGNVPTGVPK